MRAGLPHGQSSLICHGLRHTTLTWMADAGVELHFPRSRSCAAAEPEHEKRA